ncbi:MAG: antitoxin PrlF [Bacillota bacterium]|nr:antitoxin PrlF [Bacillota bacterium]
MPYMADSAVALVTSKGQVTIPKKIRERLQLVAGDRVVFCLNEKQEVVLRKVALVPLETLTEPLAAEARKMGYSSKDLEQDLEEVRRETFRKYYGKNN